MARPRLERRYSADHIRQQPEYKFLTSGEHGPYTKIAISITNFQDRRKDKHSNAMQRRASVGNFVNSQSLSFTGQKIPQPPTPAFRTGAEVDRGINILHKVDKKFSSVSAITRPKTSDGFRRKLSSCNSMEDACNSETNRISRNGSSTSSRTTPVCDTSAGSSGRDRPPTAGSSKAAHRARSAYDAKLEKSTTFLYGKGKSFSGASKYLSYAGPGVRNLQLHYTETNTAQNDAVIFADLLRIANYRNFVVGESVYGLERRLYVKRKDPGKATTFFDQRSDAFAIPEQRKPPRTVAQKSKERKEKIKQKNEEIKLGYLPTARSLKTSGPDEIEELRRNCRYLRIHPKLQKHLYGTDAHITSLSPPKTDVKSQRKEKHCKIEFSIPSNDQYCCSADSDGEIPDNGQNPSSVEDDVVYSDCNPRTIDSNVSRNERYPGNSDSEILDNELYPGNSDREILDNERYPGNSESEISGKGNNRDDIFVTEVDDECDEDYTDVFNELIVI